MAIPKKQSQTLVAGFGLAKKTNQRKRLVIAVDGKERTGKTTFGMSAPGPIAYFPLDPGREGVIDKYYDDDKVYLPLNSKGQVETYSYKDATDQEQWKVIWEKLKSDYMKMLADVNIRTLVVDTFSEAYELARLARLGKLTQVMPHQYTIVNAELRDMITRIYDTDKNLVLIHKVKKEYVNDRWSGDYERQGFGGAGYLVQINLTLEWNKNDGFTMIVKDCRQNMTIAGEVYSDPMVNFQWLAMQVYQESEEKDWQ